jgi:transposase
MFAETNLTKIKLGAEEKQQLLKISKQREASAAAIERAKILLALSEGESVQAIAEERQTNRKKIYACLKRFYMVGPLKALEDLPRSGRPPSITVAAKTWVRALSCRTPDNFGHPHGSWTVDLLQQHVRTTCESIGHASLSRVSQSTIWEIMNKAEVKPHRITYCMTKVDADFDTKANDVLHLYATAKLIRDSIEATKQNREAVPLMPLHVLLSILKPAESNDGGSTPCVPGAQESAQEAYAPDKGLPTDRQTKGKEPSAQQSLPVQDATGITSGTTASDANQSSMTNGINSTSEIASNSPSCAESENANKEKSNVQNESSARKSKAMRKEKKHFPYRVASSGLAELVSLLKEQQKTKQFQRLPLAIISYDEKPGIQAIGNKYPDLPPVPHKHKNVGRNSEYVRHGTVSLLAGKDLLTGHVHRLMNERHRSKEFVQYLQHVDSIYPKEWIILTLLDNHSAHLSKETVEYLDTVPDRFRFVFTPVHSSWLNTIECFFSKMSRSVLRRLRVSSKADLIERIEKYLSNLNESPKVFRWNYGLDKLLAA